LTGASAVRWFFERAAGIDRRRRLPVYAKQTLAGWYRSHRRGSSESATGPRVLLFGDTFANFYEPQVGVAAVQILNALGFSVELADVGCCGRPLISTGLLQEAKIQGAQLVRRLNEEFPSGDPILVLEPSCYAVLKDDYLDLLEDRQAARAVADRVFSLEEFLCREEIQVRLQDLLGPGPSKLLFHAHCQQKALIGSGAGLSLLGMLPGSKLEEVPEGCCGMAGAFGYEKRHYDLSEKIGSRHLFPAVRRCDEETAVVVPGFSCRSQVAHFTGRKVEHPAEVVARILKAH
jgi:Fe-S oxidoreductase